MDSPHYTASQCAKVRVNQTLEVGGVHMRDITTIGIDLAKNSFAVVGLNEDGKAIFRKTLRRNKLLSFIAQCL